MLVNSMRPRPNSAFRRAMSIVLTIALCFGIFPWSAASARLDPRSDGSISPTKSTPQEFAPGQIIVKFKSKTAIHASSIGILNKRHAMKKRQRIFSLKKRRSLKAKLGLENVYLLSLDRKSDVPKAAKAFANDPNVVYAEPNFAVSVDVTPNDPYYSSSGSWGQPFQDLYGLHNIQAGTAWDTERGSSQTVVAVIDTGIDFTHPEISPNIWTNTDEIPGNGLDDDANGFVDDSAGWDFYNEDNNPVDDHGHGTHVSGTIAAATDNALGIAGVSWYSKIMPVKFLDYAGNGWTIDGVAALEYAADNGADVINNSWSSGYSNLVEDAVNYAHAAGAVVVASAGNDSTDPSAFSPAGNTNAVTVAALGHLDTRAYFSNYGDAVELSAPGVHILSLRAAGTTLGGVVGTNYVYLNGTSMAAPHVSGVAALVASHNPAWTNAEIIGALNSTADNIDGRNPDYVGKLGVGRVNAARAVTETPKPVFRGLTVAVGGGNGNTVVEPGESSVSLAASLRNIGAAATGTVAVLSSASPYVTIETSAAAYGDVAAWSSTANPTDTLVFSVSPDVPAYESLQFTLTFTANSGAFSHTEQFVIRTSDMYEPNDNFSQATDHPSAGSTQTHAAMPAGDVDWIRFDAIAGDRYAIKTLNLSADMTPSVALYQDDGTTLESVGLGAPPVVQWQASATGSYLVRVAHQSPGGTGRYDLSIGPDTEPPAVVSVTPAAGSSDIEANVQVLAMMTEKLDPQSVTSATVHLQTSGVPGWIPATVELPETTAGGSTIILTPKRPLNTETTYTATVGAVKDLIGNEMGSDYVWSFRTTDFGNSGYEFRQLTGGSSPRDARINNSGQIVWTASDGSDFEIFTSDGSSTVQLTSNGGYGDIDPEINSSGDIVWAGYDGSDYEIYLYSGGTTTKITDNTGNDWSPDINDNGELAWSGSDGEIYLYSEGATTRLTNDGYNNNYPQINNNGQIVWWRSNPQRQVMLYDGSTVMALSGGDTENFNPHLNELGEVTWFASDGYDNQIFLYRDGFVSQVTSTKYSKMFPSLSDTGKLAWYGFEGFMGYTDTEIFTYEGTATTKITDNDYNDGGRQTYNDLYTALFLNSSNLMLWRGWTGNADAELYINNGIQNIRLTSNGVDDNPYDLNDLGQIVYESAGQIWLASPNAIAPDTVAPITGLNTNPSAPDGDGEWFKTAPTIDLTPNETATTYYLWDGAGAWEQYSGSLTAPEGVHTLDYFSIDGAGNYEAPQRRIFQVDTELPYCADYSSQSHSINTPSSDNTIDMRISTAGDDASGVEGFSVLWDHSATGTPDATIDIPGGSDVNFTSDPLTDGIWYSHMIIKDFAGNWSSVYHSGPYIIAPSAPPTTYYSTSPPTARGDNGWFVTNPTIYLTVDTTANPEPTTTYYSWDSTAPASFQQYTGPLAGPGDYEHTLFYYSESTQGVEPLNSTQIKVDTTGPIDPTLSSPSHSVNTTSTNNVVTVDLAGAADVPSGVAGYSITWSQNNTETPSQTLNTSTSVNSVNSQALSDGSWWVNVSTKDNAGNWTSTAHLGPFIIEVDVTPPLTSLTTTPSPANGDNGWFLALPAVSLTRNEPGTTYYQIDSTSSAGWISGDSTVAQEGEHTIYYFSADVVGNTETVKNQLVKVDTELPYCADYSSQSHGVSTPSSDDTIDMRIVTAGDDVSGVEGFSVLWDHSATGTPDATIDIPGGSNVYFSSDPLTDGTWYSHMIIKDFAGNWSSVYHSGPYIIATPPTPPGAGQYEEDDAALTYTGTWNTVSDANASGGASKQSVEVNASASFAFSGNQVVWVGKKANDMGNTDVYIDSTYVGTVDQYNRKTQYQQAIFDSGTLTEGNHTIELVVTGAKRNKSRGVTVDLDAFDVLSESSPPTEPYRVEGAITTGVWATEINSAASAGASKYSDEIDASAKLWFSGTEITWVGKTASDMGKADVYIDDVYIATVDQWSKNAKYQQTLFDSGALSSGSHTIEIVVLHQKRKRSRGYFVDIDAFDITL